MKHLHPRCLLLSIGAVMVVSLLAACGGGNDYTPKPQAYLRIDLPPHLYDTYDTTALPFTFDYSRSALVQWKEVRHVDTLGRPVPAPRGERWLTVIYPQYKGYLFLTYKPLHSLRNFQEQVDTAYKSMQTHFVYSSGIDENRFVDAAHHLYGTTYRIKGQNVASTYQFWVSDSTHHFLRGAFYIDETPNSDSLAPILNYIQDDIDHLIETLRWK